MKRKFTKLLAALGLLALFILPMKAWATTDVINNSATSSYTGNTATSTWVNDFSITGTSGATYYIHTMGTNGTTNALQFNKNGYLYMTGTSSSGDVLKSVTIIGTSGKTLDIFAKTTAYSAAPTGTAVTTMSLTGSAVTYTFESNTNYTYLAIKGKASSTQIVSISIEWESSGGGGSATTYTVTYKANGGTGADIEEIVNENSDVTVANNTFKKSGNGFVKWNTEDDGSGTSYLPGATIQSVNNDIDLYAQWEVLTYDFGAHQDFINSWNTTYTERTLAYSDADVVFASANKQSSGATIDDQPVTKGGDVELKLTENGATMSKATFFCTQWGTNAQTITLHYSTNGGTSYSDFDPAVTSTTFTITKDNLPAGTNAVKITFSNTSKQVGILGATIAKTASTNPSLSAENVNLLYNATSGSINYTLTNPQSGGAVSAAITAGNTGSWLSNGDPSNSNASGTVALTCSANTGAERTATVTLTYTYGENQIVTKDVVITQAAAPVIYSTIPEIFAAATNIGGTEDNVNVTFGNWVVSGVNGSNAFVTDNNGNGFIIYKKDHNFAVNDKLSGTVMGTPLKLYKGSAEFTNLTNTTEGLSSNNDGTITVITDKTIESLGGVNTGAVITLSNLTYDGTNLSDGTNTIKPYNTLYSDMSFSSGKTYNVTGVYQQFDQTKEILPRSAGDIVEVTLTTPTITVANTTINASAAGTNGTLEVFYTQIEISAGLQILWYENDGITPATYDWVDADFDNENNVYYTIDANSGEARTAYFKVYGVDADVNDVFSDLVTINQAKFVADYATLPFAFDKGKADIENTSGLTQEGLGSDYSSSPKLKFDGTGDFVILKINERPGTLTFDIKGNSFSGSTFKVQTSEDGTTYTDLATYTSFGTGNEQLEETYDNLGENVRYIKWIYTEKVQNGGNVGLGNIQLAKYVAPIIVPAITLDSYAINAPCSATDGTLTVTYTAIETSAGVEIIWCDENGNALSDQTEYEDWILSDFATNNINTIEYTIEANDGAERKAYFKVYGLDADGNDVYSDLVTVTQAVYVPDYAILPFEFINKGKNDIENTNGLTHSGLGSDYGDDNSKLKFDNTEDNLVLKLNAAPKSITFNIKGNTFSGGTFSVQVSEDNTTYTDLAVFTDAIITGSNQTFTLLNTNEDVRFIKWIYTEKAQGGGNIGLGNIYVDDEYLVRGKATISGDITLDECTIQESGKLTIESGTLNVTTSLTNEATSEAWNNLVIKDGAQLKTPNEVNGTVEKVVAGYGSSEKNNYVLLATPATMDACNHTGMWNTADQTQHANVDLYAFDQVFDGQEWRNYKYGNTSFAGPIAITQGTGYLYANKEDVTLTLETRGYVSPNSSYQAHPFSATSDDIDVAVSYSNDKPFAGWNLIGNPFTCKAYLDDGSDFYRMNADGNGLIINTDAQGGGNAINVCEGIFVETTASKTSVTFTTTDPTVTSTGNNNGMVNISVAQVVNSRDAQPSADYARIRVNNGKDMTKFVFNENTSRVYIPQNGKDYAVVRSAAQGEMPVNFKAAENGTYTIDVEAENLEVNYLHLIDNMTGMDVDLLATPSYTFEARKSDIASRFRLVFDANTGNDETNDNFAFINNGELIVNGNGTVQVIDILGRQMFSHEVNSSFRIQNSSFAPGVYVLRLVNGNDVKTQKIVIK